MLPERRLFPLFLQRASIALHFFFHFTHKSDDALSPGHFRFAPGLLLLATSVVSSIGAPELFHQAAFIDSRTYRSFESYALITLTYLVLTLAFRALFAGLHWLLFVRRARA